MTTRAHEPEFYTDEAGEVRWRVRGDNGEIVDAATEGFVNLRKAWDNYNIGLQNKAVSYEEAKEQHAQGHIADNSGSAGEGEEADTNSGEGGTGGSAGSSSGSNAAPPEAGDPPSEVPGRTEG